MQRPVDEFVEHLTEVVGGRSRRVAALRALTHRSYAYENGGLPNNERLEFLGDSVLGLVVTDTLYATHPDLPEGQLAKLRAAVVNMRALADVARTLGLGDYVLLGPRRGDHRRPRQGLDPRRHDGGASSARSTCRAACAAAGDARAPPARPADGASRPPSVPAWTGRPACRSSPPRRRLGVPEYRVEEEGPDHEKTFHARAVVGDEVLGTGTGRSKKEAEQRAAELAWRALSARTTPLGPAPVPRSAGRPPRRRPTRPAGVAHRRSAAPVPELPEVEVVRRGLADHVVGRTITAAEFRGARVARRHLPGPLDLAARLAGNRVEQARRRGKYLWLVLRAPDGSRQGLIAHLGMSGQLLVEAAGRPRREAPARAVHLRRRRTPSCGSSTSGPSAGMALAELDARRRPRADRAHRARPARGGLRPRRGRARG